MEQKKKSVSLTILKTKEMRLKDRVAIVTGGARGFGEGIARGLAAEGAKVVVADLNGNDGPRIADEIEGTFIKTDVTDAQSVRNLVDETVRLYGSLDLFVSDAGVIRAGAIDTLDVEDFDRITEVNYKAFFLCAREAARVMKRQNAEDPQRYGDIVQINSKSGLRGSKANFAYSGSKFGSIGLVQSFALDLAPFRIKVNCVCPGNYYESPLWSDPGNGLFIQYLKAGKVPGAKTVEDVRNHYISQSPMHKGCTPKDVCTAILYAVEQTGETGQAIPVTGGQVMLG